MSPAQFDMPNIASAFRTDILRVARREVRTEIESLKKAFVLHRSSITTLRRQIAALERELRKNVKPPTGDSAAQDLDQPDDSPKRRFSPARLAAHRGKLGLSAAAYGRLVGVSGQSIYHWEQGKTRPRAAQLESLARARHLSARDAAQLLGS